MVTIPAPSRFALVASDESGLGSIRTDSSLPESSLRYKSTTRPNSSPSVVMTRFPASCFAIANFTMSVPPIRRNQISELIDEAQFKYLSNEEKNELENE